jgi:hypothetical protein
VNGACGEDDRVESLASRIECRQLDCQDDGQLPECSQRSTRDIPDKSDTGFRMDRILTVTHQ